MMDGYKIIRKSIPFCYKCGLPYASDNHDSYFCDKCEKENNNGA